MGAHDLGGEPLSEPSLVLGPIVRGMPPDGLAVWVETSEACEVTVLDRTAPTFRVGDHHYALVELGPLEGRVDADDELIEYEVALDGTVVWPERDDRTPTALRLGPADRLVIMAGSCRQQAPRPLWLGRPSAGFGDLGPDALATLAAEVMAGRRSPPHLLLLTGDQVYADEQHRTVRRELRRRRGGPPAKGTPEVTSFEEYTWLYQKTWSHPLIRWMLGTVPSLMIFDDHDVIDDWNISDTWAADIDEHDWWRDRIRAALMSYWVYQHIGNLSPERRAVDELYQAVLAADDGEPILAEHAGRVARGSTDRLDEPWSFRHRSDLLDLVVLDTRNARVLESGRRSMLAPADWALLEAVLDPTVDAEDHEPDRVGRPPGGGSDRVVDSEKSGSGVGPDRRHVLIVSSVPWALPVGIHRLQELVSGITERPRRTRWDAILGSTGERVRRAIDLEHWSAFGDSYERLFELLRAAPTSRIGSAVVLSGDVHFGYIAEITVGGGRRSVHQVVASPLRQVEMGYERVARQVTMGRIGRVVLDRLTRWSRAEPSDVSFAMCHGPVFDNNIATLTYVADKTEVALERAVMGDGGSPELQPIGTKALPSPTRT